MQADSKPGVDRIRTIAPKDRIEHVNHLMNRIKGANAAEHYDRAERRFVPVSQLIDWRAPEKEQRPINHVDYNDAILAMIPEWTKEESTVIGLWLEKNDKTLKALNEAVNCKRHYVSLTDPKNRLHEAAIAPGTWASLRQFTRLMAVKARCAVQAGSWEDAYLWNLGIHRVVDHMRQSPFQIRQLPADVIECIACCQTLAFMSERMPDDPAALLRQIEEADDTRCSDQLSQEAEDLFNLDWFEAFYRWAENSESEPDIDELAETMTEDPMGVGESIKEIRKERNEPLPETAFRTRKELRRALSKSSVDEEWQTHMGLCEHFAVWSAKPFHEAWREADSYRQGYFERAKKTPLNRMATALGYSISPDRSRFIWETARLHRRAIEAVVAIELYRRKYGRLPNGLTDLRPAFLKELPIDSFSGKSMVYRRTVEPLRYTLYSVAADQKDDGGKHNRAWLPAGDYVFWPPQLPERISVP